MSDTLTPGEIAAWGVPAYPWLDVIDRARISPITKAIAGRVARYGNPDGSNVRPGIPRLTYATGYDYKTVQHHMGLLRRYGLLGLVRRGCGRRGDRPATTDVYRLILHPDVMERIEVDSPTQADDAIEQIREQKQGRPKSTRTLHPAARGAIAESDPLMHPAGRGANAAETVDNMGTPDPATVDDHEMHPAARGALEAPPGINAPRQTTCKTVNAPRLTPLMHPVGRDPTYQVPPIQATNQNPLVDGLDTDLTVPRARNEDRHLASVDDDPHLATVLPFRRREAS